MESPDYILEANKPKTAFILKHICDNELRLASTARVSKVTLLTKDSFIFKIGDFHKDDLKRVEDMYRKFLSDNGVI